MHTISLQPSFFMPVLTNSCSVKELTDDTLLFSFFSQKESYLCLPSDCTTVFLWKNTSWQYQIYQSMTAPFFLSIPNTLVFCVRFFTPHYILTENRLESVLTYFNHADCHHFLDFIRLYHRFLAGCLNKRSLHPILPPILEAAYQADGCLSVREISAHSGYSQRHLIRLFQKDFACKPKEYFNLLRFLRALTNIYISPSSKNSAFIEKLNYCDQAHFQKDFKHYTSMTPRQFAHKFLL